MNMWLRKIRGVAPLKEWWPILAAKLAGHYRYYGVSGNYSSLMRYHSAVIRLAKKWVNRRSQKRSYNWERYLKYLERYPLPKPKIYHNMYTLSPSR